MKLFWKDKGKNIQIIKEIGTNSIGNDRDTCDDETLWIKLAQYFMAWPWTKFNNLFATFVYRREH